MVVSQFTLWGDCKKQASGPPMCRPLPESRPEPLYEAFCTRVQELGLEVATGSFGAMMQVHLINHGPVDPFAGYGEDLLAGYNFSDPAEI